MPATDIRKPRKSGVPNPGRPTVDPAIAGTIRPHRRMALVLWLTLAGIWGSTWLAIKLGLRDLPPLTFAGIRFALAAMYGLQIYEWFDWCVLPLDAVVILLIVLQHWKGDQACACRSHAALQTR